MKECNISKQLYEDKYMCKTIDGFNINNTIYKHCYMDAKNSILTLKECKDIILYNNKFNKLFKQYLLLLRSNIEAYTKHDCIKEGIKTIREWQEMEDEFSIMLWKKAGNCTNKEEKTYYFSRMLLLLESNKRETLIFDGTESQACVNEYTKINTGCNFWN
jgi:hypothetical protein